MLKIGKSKIESRPDLLVISEIIPPGMKVMDLGCGAGELLRFLRDEKDCKVAGIEISQDNIIKCVENGVPVVHGDLNDGLGDLPDKSFDFVVLSQTLQAVDRPDKLLIEMARVGRKVVVSFINIGYWECRMQIAVLGRMPVTKTLPNYWYDTPNIHLGTITDFRAMCKTARLRIHSETPIARSMHGLARFFPNMFAPTCVFVIGG